MTFTVTIDDIHEGVPRHDCKCAVGLAMNRALAPLGALASVGPHDVTVYDRDGGTSTWDLPPSAQTFVHAFDFDPAGCMPMSFTIADLDERRL